MHVIAPIVVRRHEVCNYKEETDVPTNPPPSSFRLRKYHFIASDGNVLTIKLIVLLSVPVPSLWLGCTIKEGM